MVTSQFLWMFMVSIYRPNSNICILDDVYFSLSYFHISLFVKAWRKRIRFISQSWWWRRSAFFLKCFVQLKVNIFSKWPLAFIYFITKEQVFFYFQNATILKYSINVERLSIREFLFDSRHIFFTYCSQLKLNFPHLFAVTSRYNVSLFPP